MLLVSATTSLHVLSTSATKRNQPKEKANETKFPPLRLTLTDTGTGTGTRHSRISLPCAKPGRGTGASESDPVGPTVSVTDAATRVGLWAMEAVYILWLFLLPYAPVSTLIILFSFLSHSSLYTYIHTWLYNYTDFLFLFFI